MYSTMNGVIGHMTLQIVTRTVYSVDRQSCHSSSLISLPFRRSRLRRMYQFVIWSRKDSSFGTTL